LSKLELYRQKLRSLDSWDEFLLEESGLPGPRGNIELAMAVAEEGSPELFQRYSAYGVDRGPVNSPYEFLAFCGVVGMGRLLAQGHAELLEILRVHASDPRWRVREAVAMALQRLGERSMERLLAAMRKWSRGAPLEQRAAAAALCEPKLLGRAEHTREVLEILDEITASVERSASRRSDDFLALRKGLGYCWSVAVAALPEEGKIAMEKWFASPDRDIGWIMRENLKKKRLARMDPQWVQKWSA
jgi:hypothetical protein